MEALGRRIAAVVSPGDILSLNGPLGAGKTLLVSGIAQGLGVDQQVTSPTFLVAKIYDSGVLPLVHVDVYRLATTAEFNDLELIQDNQDALIAIEWGRAVRSGLPPDLLTVDIDVAESGARSVRFTLEGEWHTRSLEELFD